MELHHRSEPNILRPRGSWARSRRETRRVGRRSARPGGTVRAMRLAAVPLALVLATSCVGIGALGMPRAHPVSALSDRAVTVGSFDFPESSLLAELYAQAVEGAGVHVIREFGLGPRELILPALEKGVVELLPEYAGSALAFVTLQESSGAAGPIQTTGALRVALAPSGVDVLQPSPAEAQNAGAITLSTARRFGLSDVSELRDVAAQLTFGGPPECTERSYCLLGLEQTYGLHFKRFVSLDAGGPLTIEALRSGA